MTPDPKPTALVTGSTDGIGKGLATELARSRRRVLVHGRDDGRGERTLADIRAAVPDADLGWYKADLSSLDEVRSLAERVEANELRLNVLVNNAGVGTKEPGGGARLESEDGYELRLAVNYLAPFLLSRLLIPKLVASAPARIVNVTSVGQWPIDFDDPQLERSFDSMTAYRQSKLALIMSTLDLADELAGTGVTATCLHPGRFMPTKLVLADGLEPVDTVETGVRTTLRLAADPDLDGVTGRYYDRLEESTAQPQAYDLEARARLRELSERLTGLS
jgi:NAD(P)-dependent dehydrogenase (short-subunit alcohol dehydrogenase family)